LRRRAAETFDRSSSSCADAEAGVQKKAAKKSRGGGQREGNANADRQQEAG
jgi:hypothetical protein